jgi:hypothetical protein
MQICSHESQSHAICRIGRGRPQLCGFTAFLDKAAQRPPRWFPRRAGVLCSPTGVSQQTVTGCRHVRRGRGDGVRPGSSSRGDDLAKRFSVVPRFGDFGEEWIGQNLHKRVRQ